MDAIESHPNARLRDAITASTRASQSRSWSSRIFMAPITFHWDPWGATHSSNCA